ncbi:unnamed protein product [Rotaria sp. Silwood1]|nr:unnamed protein product [Rotaria sp. Silwood1]CAF3715489.1 unnamed protein product [Rotaria sp. Silwood1]CAF4855102.1 unnamed protein product [Rotaria sp. Silwood1]CAF4867810.1 unnamed protein product [Rotaria sp. Silwood1]
MNAWVIINIFLNLLTLINSILTILICSLIFLLIIISHRRSRSVPVLLAGNTCSTLFISAFMLASMANASLFGYMNIVLEQHNNTIWCRLRGFFIHGFLCALYDSYILQATYRLCRVVFYRHKQLHSFPLYSILVPIESLFGIVSISPVLLRGDVIYLRSEYYCQTPFTNISAITYIAIRLFLLPILFITLIYLCLLKYVRQSNLSSITINDNHQRRSKQNKRDLIVIRRILLMLSILILLGLPSMIFLTIFMFTGHLIYVTYRIGWLSVSFSLIFLAYMLIRLTDPLKKTVRRYVKQNFLRQNRYQTSSERQISLHGY